MKVWRVFWRIVDWVMVAILTSMIVLVFTNVVLRYGFSSGLRQSVELSRLGMVWLTLVGAAVLLRREEHIGLREFSESFFPRAVPFLRRLAYVVVLISTLMWFWGAFNQMNRSWADISQITGLPRALFYLAGVVSAVLMSAIAFARIFDPDLLVDDDHTIEEQEGRA